MKGSRRVKTSTKSRVAKKASSTPVQSSVTSMAGIRMASTARRSVSASPQSTVTASRSMATTTTTKSSVSMSRKAVTTTLASASRSFATEAAPRRLNINWKRCESPLEPESVREFKDHEAKIDAMWRDVYSAPTEVAPIKWSEWEAKIKDKKAVAELKKEYEAKTFTAQKSLYQSAEAEQKAVKAAENHVEFLKAVIDKFKNEIAETRALSSYAPFLSFYQRVKVVPGLDEEFDRQLCAFQQITPESTIRALDTVNPKKMLADLQEGKIPNLPHEAIQATLGTPVFLEIMKSHDAFVQLGKKYGVELNDAVDIIGDEREKLGIFQDDLSYTQQFEDVSVGNETDYKNDAFVKDFIAKASALA